jgi:hypothetical protein
MKPADYGDAGSGQGRLAAASVTQATEGTYSQFSHTASAEETMA